MSEDGLSMTEMNRLIERYLDGLLSDTERAELEATLRSSPEAARRLARAARFERLIERQLRQPAEMMAVPTRARIHRLPFGHWSGWREHAWGPLAAIAIHAGLIIVLVRWVIWPAGSRRGDEIEITMEPAREAPNFDRPPEMPQDDIPRELPESTIARTAEPNLPESAPPTEQAMPPLDSLSVAAGPAMPSIVHPLVNGRFGNRRTILQRELPPLLAEAVERATRHGVAWLVSRQSANGAWRELGTDEVGLTSLALLALSTRSELIQGGEYAAQFRAAMDFLAHTAWETDSADLRSSILRLNALADGQAVLRVPRWHVAVERAVARVLSAERPTGGWGVSLEYPDPVVTAWAVMGLRVAASIGVEQHRIQLVLARAAEALNSSPTPTSGLLYYPPLVERSTANLSDLAGSILTLQLAGESAGPRTVRGLHSLHQHWSEPTRHLRESGGLDAVWLAACAHHQAGGATWLRFYTRCASALLKARNDDGVWSAHDGHPSVRTTSLAVLTLETPWRYPPTGQWPVTANWSGSTALYARR